RLAKRRKWCFGIPLHMHPTGPAVQRHALGPGLPINRGLPTPAVSGNIAFCRAHAPDNEPNSSSRKPIKLPHLASFHRCHPATAGQRQLDRLLASNPFRFALGFARCRIAKAPEVDPASVVWPAGDLGLPQRGPAVLMRLIDAYHPAELAVGALDALGPGAPCPDLLASDQLGEPHDLTAPTLAVMAGRLATLKQQLVGHLVEQGVVVGEQRSVVLGHVECDGEASAIGAGV